MKRFLISLLLATLVVVPMHAQLPTLSYQGYYTAQPNGNDSTYIQAFTTRRVNGALRFLVLTHTGHLIEFASGAVIGGPAGAETGRWDLSAFSSEHRGISFDEAKNRLWLTNGDGYTTDTNPARLSVMTLGANGAISNVKTFTLSNVVAKRVWGSVQLVPAAMQAAIGRPYAAIGGGYTSLTDQGGKASIGPAVYGIPDPDTLSNGARVAATIVLDASASRGVRKTIPLNYFDGGDARSNPSTRPTVPPASRGGFLSPRRDGLGWMVWGDATYSSGFFLGDALVEVWSLCKGACWYQTSTLAFDDRQFELHAWRAASLGKDRLKAPDSMTELVVPKGAGSLPFGSAWQGNTPAGNISGASYDASSGNVYMLGCPLGDGPSDCRIYVWSTKGGEAPAPLPTAAP